MFIKVTTDIRDKRNYYKYINILEISMFVKDESGSLYIDGKSVICTAITLKNKPNPILCIESVEEICSLIDQAAASSILNITNILKSTQ